MRLLEEEGSRNGKMKNYRFDRGVISEKESYKNGKNIKYKIQYELERVSRWFLKCLSCGGWGWNNEDLLLVLKATRTVWLSSMLELCHEKWTEFNHKTACHNFTLFNFSVESSKGLNVLENPTKHVHRIIWEIEYSKITLKVDSEMPSVCAPVSQKLWL